MAHESNVHPHIPGESSIRALGRLIAPLAARQHGVVSRFQLDGLGLSKHQIDRLIAAGHLHCVFRGVYAVGNPRLTREGRFMAAVLAGGPGFVLSDAAAADLHGWRPLRDADVEVSGPRERRKQPGLHPHCRQLASYERTTRQGIPVTTPARTIFDLAATLNASQLENLIRKAEYANHQTLALLAESLKKHPNRRGNTALNEALTNAQAGKGITREELEQRFKRMLRAHAIPPPQFNAPIHLEDRTYEVDCLWPNERLVVELDGRDAHMTAAAFEDDRVRDAALVGAGLRVIRITWRRLHDAEADTASQLVALLSTIAD